MADLRSYIWGAALGGDNLAAPANDVQIVGTFGFLFDGTNWDRAPGNSVDGTLVNLGANNDVTVTGTVTVDSELPAAAALTDNFANPTAPAVGAFLMAWDGVTWDRAPGTAADGVLVNLGANNDVTVTGTVTVDSELASAAALADNAANPTTALVGACLLGFDGTTWDRIYAVADGDAVVAATKGLVLLGTDGTNYQVLKTDANGELQIDVLTGGSEVLPTNPTSDYVTSAALAAGGEANLDTADLPAKKLWKVTVWASVPYRARVFLVNNSVEDTEALAVGGGGAMQGWSWKPPHRNFTTLGTSAGTDAFRMEFINLDQENAGDVHAAFNYADN